MIHTGAIGYLVIVIWPFTFNNSEGPVDALAVKKGESLTQNLKSRDASASKNDKQILAGSQTILIIWSSWTISEWGGRLHEQGLPIMVTSKQGVSTWRRASAWWEGGKASAWMAASYVSALAAFTQWQKHTGCQAFESISSSKLFDIILSQKGVSGGDLKKV